MVKNNKYFSLIVNNFGIILIILLSINFLYDGEKYNSDIEEILVRIAVSVIVYVGILWFLVRKKKNHANNLSAIFPVIYLLTQYNVLIKSNDIELMQSFKKNINQIEQYWQSKDLENKKNIVEYKKQIGNEYDKLINLLGKSNLKKMFTESKNFKLNTIELDNNLRVFTYR